MESRQEQSGELGGDLKDRVSSAPGEPRGQAADLVSSARRQALEAADRQRKAGAEQIHAIAGAVDSAADRLRGEMPRASELVHDLARNIEAAASALRERSADDLLRQAGTFARRQPGLFFTGAALTGLALARFLKSSSASTRDNLPG